MTTLAEVTSSDDLPSPAAIPEASPQLRSTSNRSALGLGLLVAAAALGLMVWDAARPALWLDESASVLATQRSWSNLWQLLNGADAPLVPYYALLKLATSAGTALNPDAVSSPEILFRFPSMAATVLAAGTLTMWMARRFSASLAIATATALLTAAGVSRYGQEARPYAFALLLAVVCTIAWARMIRDRSRLWVALYALSIVLLVSAHLLAGTVVAAHLVTALIAAPSDRPERWTAARRTVLGAGLGWAISSPFALLVGKHGVGPTTVGAHVTPDRVTSIFIHNLTDSPRPFLGIGVLLALAAVGLSQTLLRRYRFIARLALAWAIVPPAVLLPLMVLRPNLLIGRYLIFVIPGVAILSGLGVVTMMDLVRRLLNVIAFRSFTQQARPPRGHAASSTILSGAVAGLLLTALVVSQISSLTGARTPWAHGEDIRPSLAVADRPEYAGLPIALSSLYSAVELSAYHRADEHRLIGQHSQRNQRSIWPILDSTADTVWSTHPRLVFLFRTPSSAVCRHRSIGTTADYVTRCMPRELKKAGYRVESAVDGGYRWTFSVLVLRVKKKQPPQPGTGPAFSS
jgi:mannosyltransferase